MKTKSAKAKELQKEWFVIDAQDQVLGRLATRVATVLRGKHKPTYTPHADTGDFVVVVNAGQVKVTGKKETQKLYWRHTGYPGGEKSVTLGKQRAEHPERIIQHAVKGMLPKGPLGRQLIKKLKVYPGPEHPHKAQKPETLSV
jgi:large subunit ribosomal protein L13